MEVEAATAAPSAAVQRFSSTRITPIMSTTKPNWDIQNETGLHRLICYRTAAGDTAREIASAMGVTPQTVHNVLKQDRSRQLVAQLIHENFNDDIGQMLKGAASEAIMVQIDLMKSAQDESVRLRSATDILNRAFGTPCKANEMRQAVADDPMQEMAELDRQLSALEGGVVHEAEEIPLNDESQSLPE